MASCIACGAQVARPVICTGCQCLYFCGAAHQKEYIEQGGHSVEDCARLREFRASALEDGFYTTLEALFPWCTTGQLYSSPCELLKKIGVHTVDPFRMECPCGSASSGPLLKDWFGPGSRETQVDVTTESLRSRLDAWWGVEGTEYILQASPVESYESIVDWQSYIEYKGMGTLTVLLDIPLTLFWAIKRYLRRNSTDIIKIVLAGVEKEMGQWPVLLELFNLLPGYSFDITMAGPELPSWLDHKRINITSSSTSKSMTIRCKATTLTDAASIQLMTESHMVCALNAGIGAYPSWMDTVCKVKALMATKHSPTMFFFTDYVQESIEVARKNLYMLFGKTCVPEYEGKLPFLGNDDITMACGGHPQYIKECTDYLAKHVRVTGVLMNPFRKPANVSMPSHGMPYASNGFGCSLEIR